MAEISQKRFQTQQSEWKNSVVGGKVFHKQNVWRRSKNGPLKKNHAMKRKAVERAHVSITKILERNGIPRVAKAFGIGIVRVCCRTMTQLEHIDLYLTELIKFNLIQGIGMPLTYSYKMKTLVLFIKPTSADATKELELFFKASRLGYRQLVIEVDYPTLEANNTLKKGKEAAINEPASHVKQSELNSDDTNEKLSPIQMQEIKLETVKATKTTQQHQILFFGFTVIVSSFFVYLWAVVA